jgi:hypothetical protein
MMKNELSIELFTQVRSDIEKNQYLIRAVLQNIKKEFQHNRIYPYLSHLINLYRTLSDIANQLEDLRSRFPKRIKKVDFVNQKIEREVIFGEESDIKRVQELIGWALPYIEETIEEGKTIYEFVNKEIELQEVGIIPNYTDEGYLFVPNNKKSQLLLFEYQVSIFRRTQDKYRSLKTTFLRSKAQNRAKLSPNAVKLDLIDENKKLPNPAAYSFQTALYFPFNETIFPIVKRKLLKRLVAGDTES